MKAYYGYDYTFIDRLIAKQVRFAIYKRPFSDSICFVMQKSEQNCVIEDLCELGNQEGFVLMPFAVTTKNPLILIRPDVFANNEKTIFDYIVNMASDMEPANNNFIIDKTIKNENFDNYRKDYTTFHNALKKRDLEKLVLSRSVQYNTNSQFSAGKIFNKAIEKYPDAFVYLANTPESGAWFGCTPELLLSDDNTFCHTVALAGTMSSESDLNWSEKDRNEQKIVVEYMQQQLHSLGIKYCQNETHNAKAGNLVHLKTEFSFKKKNTNISELLKTLHPTPAVCGFPKQKAFDFIRMNETCNREYYSGFIGPIDIQNGTDLYVNLRCMKIEPGILTLYAGGGILESSDLDKEWAETESKLQTLLSIINE